MTTSTRTTRTLQAVPSLRATGIAGTGVRSFDDVREDISAQWEHPQRDAHRRGQLKAKLAKAQEELSLIHI